MFQDMAVETARLKKNYKKRKEKKKQEKISC